MAEEEKTKPENEESLEHTKSDLISISAHQIRTTVSAIKWIVEMFLGGDLGKLTVEQENLLRKAHESTARAISIVNELLLVNKTEDLVEKEYNFESMDMIDLVNDSIFNFSGEAYVRGIELIFLKTGLQLPRVRVDKEKILVVLHNLIENAIKYSDMHGKVFLTLKEEEDLVQFSIKNRGVSIPPEESDKIFQKFYRSTAAKKKEAMGSGIGLFTIKKIVERHGGKIWFQSSANEGTTFFFTVPTFKQ